MSMNILVETRVAPETTFNTENPSLLPGEIAINVEGTGAKIGDGVKPWQELTYIETSREVIEKWLTIANATTSSHLVTLPDMNFAYSVVTADSNAMIEQVVDTIVQNKDYFSITEEPKENLGAVSDEDGMLVLTARGVQNVTFDTEGTARKSKISQLRFVDKGEKGRTYTLYDRSAQNAINEINSVTIPSIDARITTINTTLNGDNGIVEAINEKLVQFGLNKDGLVKGPRAEENFENFFLTGKNTWKQISLTASNVTTSDGNTVQAKLDSLQTQITNSGTKLTITSIANQDLKNYVGTVTGTTATTIQYSNGVYISNNVLMGAAWNDYAEARITPSISPGRTVVENGDDTLSLANERLLLGGNIVSDTYGMLIGQTDTAKTPIALCGRVLAYPNEELDEYYPGAPVCTGPNGTVSIMSKDEVLHYPECIIGYVSAVPTYEEWNGVKVNGRIWIKVV